MSLFGLNKSSKSKKTYPAATGPGAPTTPNNPHVWFGAPAGPQPQQPPANPYGNPPSVFGGSSFGSFGGSSFGSFGSTAKAPPQGLNRANDKVFQDLKASYLAEFDFKGIQVVATPLFSNVLRGLQTQLPVLFQVKVGQRSNAGKAEEFTRTPFNICLVLDVSGSMEGTRLDGCKMAITAIIEQLTPHDTLSLVTYATGVTTVFVDCNKSHAKFMMDAVAAIKTEGLTNLHGGLQVGVHNLKVSIMKEESAQAQEIKASEKEDNEKQKSSPPPKKAHRIFLFSDGLVNQGVTNPDQIMADVRKWLTSTDIQISTFGIGDGFNEKLMTAIAEHANGDSFFIETENDIEDLVSKGLRGVSSMVAAEATVKLRGLNDAVIKDIPDFDTTKTPGEIKLLNLRTNGLIQFVVNLDIRVPGVDDFSENDMEDVVNAKNILAYAFTLEGEHFVDLEASKGLTGKVSVNYTTDSALVADDKKDNDVVTYLTIQEAAKIDVQVLDHLANNRTDEAIKAKKKVVAMFGAVESKDRWGFTKYMQSQSERLVSNLESTGNTRYAQQMQQAQQQQSHGRDLGYGLYE